MGLDPGGVVSWVGPQASGVFVRFESGFSIPEGGSDPLGPDPDSKLELLQGR